MGGTLKGFVDLQVFSPRSQYRDERPHWLSLGGARTARRVPLNELKHGFPYLVQAFFAAEGADAVPVDQIEVRAPAQAATLFLPQGNFQVKVRNQAGEVIHAAQIKGK